MKSIVLIALLLPIAFASYCGQSAIPYTFQVIKSGRPVLGCARPKCFGWTANGTRAGDSAQFYRVAGKEDGYLRRADQFIRAPSKNPNFVPQIAICADNYKSSSCEEGEWVGGIAPQSDPFSSNLEMRCCSYQVLINSQDRGKATVRRGQLVVGGEVRENGKLVAFDYIANLKKEVTNTGNVTYYATIKRMPCFDEDEIVESEGKVDNRVVETAAVTNEISTTAPVTAKHVPSPQAQAQGVPTQHATPTNQVQQVLPNTQIYLGQQQPVQQQYQQQYGQFSQTGYGVQQNGQYTGYPQNGQLPQQTYYQDPLTAMIQQQQQQFQQGLLVQPQQMTLAPMPALYQPMGMLPVAQQSLAVSQPAASAGAAAGAAVQQPQLQITSTIAPMTLPKLEDLPKLQIPSVEDVEQVIPPVQRAILTSVAKFFGVL
ncbi:unnamed protein product [Caenorhabditis bovis]|uniref:Uncharacterized protein n=1 Tax=Caenorhabditis bovis TaxID=2654633 RepID=A0A8S1ECH2_9PELO|nr:unnamed protein product [Caenorhabditis bovis]